MKKEKEKKWNCKVITLCIRRLSFASMESDSHYIYIYVIWEGENGKDEYEKCLFKTDL